MEYHPNDRIVATKGKYKGRSGKVWMWSKETQSYLVRLDDNSMLALDPDELLPENLYNSRLYKALNDLEQ